MTSLPLAPYLLVGVTGNRLLHDGFNNFLFPTLLQGVTELVVCLEIFLTGLFVGEDFFPHDFTPVTKILKQLIANVSSNGPMTLEKNPEGGGLLNLWGGGGSHTE